MTAASHWNLHITNNYSLSVDTYIKYKVVEWWYASNLKDISVMTYYCNILLLCYNSSGFKHMSGQCFLTI